MSNHQADPAPPAAARHARQKRTLTILAFALIAGGLVVLLALERMPLPLRILVGLSDIFAGLILLVVVRQKFGGAKKRYAFGKGKGGRRKAEGEKQEEAP